MAEADAIDRVVDMHVHVFGPGYLPDSLQEATARAWSARRWPLRDPAEIRPRLEQNGVDPTGELMLADMADAGIDVSVTLTLDPGVGFPDEPKVGAVEIMTRYAELQASSGGRILAFAGIDPRRPGATDICRWALRDLGLRGVKLYPPHGYYASDAAPLEICGVAAEAGVPVMFHTAVVSPPALSYFCDPLRLSMVQREFPDLTVLIGHAGFDVWARECARVAAGHDRTYLEISQWDEVARTDPERFVRVLAMWRDIVGAHRIIFGSDHISGPGLSGARSRLPGWVGFFRTLPERADQYGVHFSPEEIAQILGGNAARVLGLDAVADRPGATS